VSTQPTAPSYCMAAAKAASATSLLPCKMSRRLPSAFHPSCDRRLHAKGGARECGGHVRCGLAGLHEKFAS
jgi:hypothetical protein